MLFSATACGLDTFGQAEVTNDSSSGLGSDSTGLAPPGQTDAPATSTPQDDPTSTTSGNTASAVLTTSEGTDASTSTSTGPGHAEASSTSGTSTTFDPNDCGEAQINIPIVAPNVMLVLDKSGSMVANPGGYWDDDNDDPDNDGLQNDGVTPATPRQTRWKSLHETVDFIVNTFNNSMNLGMNLFPAKSAKAEYSAVACPVNTMVEVPVGPVNAAAILAAMPAADDIAIKGGTPSTKGVKAALAELQKLDGGQPSFMILVTDGAANCQEGAPDNDTLFEVYDEQLPAIVAEAAGENIPTYVIGIGITKVPSGMTQDGNPDNTNSYDKLNEVAIAGGVARPGEDKFFDTQNQLDLQAALEEISMQILSCAIALELVPKYPDYVEVTVNGTPYGNGKNQVTDCATQDGWHYTKDDKSEIELCGAACESFQMIGALDAQYLCPNSG